MIYTLGESLMDIIFDTDNNIVAKAGGAMLNLSISLARCNIDVSLISEIGDDHTSSTILDFLNHNNVETKYVQQYNNQTSSIALAKLDSHKKPDYSFYKTYPIDRTLKLPNKLSNDDIIVFGSLYSLDKKIRKQIKSFLSMAKKANSLIIYDPNIRHSHHLQDKDITNSLKENIIIADIIKASDEDLTNIFDTKNEGIMIQRIKYLNPKAMIILTKGEKGSDLFIKDTKLSNDAINIEIASTVGAGDNFTAGLIYSLTTLAKPNKTSEFSKEQLYRLLESATLFSSEVCKTYDNYISTKFANSL